MQTTGKRLLVFHIVSGGRLLVWRHVPNDQMGLRDWFLDSNAWFSDDRILCLDFDK